MIKRSFDLPLLLQSISTSIYADKEKDFEDWFKRPQNLMFTEGDNVGLATYDYPGVYTVHWFFKSRGREAINLAKAMVKNLFENYSAELIRGLVRLDLKSSRWGARQTGLKSYGIVGDCELFCINKQDFLSSLKKEN